jgi:hypothetical protein
MKKLTLVLLIVCFAFSVNAQWYYNSFNVSNINDLNQDQLNLSLTKANKSIKTGQIMTGVGGGVCIIGAIMYSSGLNNMASSTTYSGINEGLNKGTAGAYIAGAGGIIASIGIPIWISGFMRKSDIEVTLVKFKPTSSINGIGLKIRF